MGEFAQSKVMPRFYARESRTLHVPEWDMELTIFPLTIGQLAAIEREPDDYRRAARIIVSRAKRPGGEPLFDEEDFSKLVTHGVGEFGPLVIARIAGEIMSGDRAEASEPETEEGASGN